MTTRSLGILLLMAVMEGCGTREHAAALRLERAGSSVPPPAVRAVGLAFATTGVGTAPGRDAATDFRAPSRFDLTGGDSVAGPPRLVAITGEASVLVDSVAPAAERLRQLAARLGGYVAGASFDGGPGSARTARLEIRIPAARFEQLVAAVRILGRVESLESASQDQGEEFVDVSARLRNAQRLEQRLIRMVETHTGRVTDLLSVERALAQTREDIERYQGRVRYLRTQAIYSTLTVTVHDLPRIAATPSEAAFLMDAFVQAWRNFLFLVAFAIQVSGVVLPLAALALLGWGVRSRLGFAGGTPFGLSLRKSAR